MPIAVHLLFFAKARELAQQSDVHLQLPTVEMTCGELKRVIFEEKFPQLQPIASTCLLAVDQRYCDDPQTTIRLRENAEIAVIPPVSGG